MQRQARICCLDLDTFFVSVERLLNPDLIGKPVVVGALPGNRGVVTAASYEVREFGVKSGMPIAKAYKLAPHAVFVPTQFGRYSPYSKQVRAILERYTPTVRAASIDEFYLGFAGCERLYRHPDDGDDDTTIERVVDEIRAAVKDETGLPCSAGIGTSHAIAKIASGRAKPAGTLMVPRGGEAAFLWRLPVRKFPGIGPVAEAKLNDAGIDTLGELVSASHLGGQRSLSGLRDRVMRTLDPSGDVRWQDERPAFHEHDEQGSTVGSISNERTFSADVGDDRKVRDQLQALCERVAWRARQRGMHARTVTLKLRYADFQTLTRARTIPATNADADILRCVIDLYEKAHTRRIAMRLVGVQLANFVPADRQQTLAFDGRPQAQIGAAVDAVRKQFGYEAIRMGATKGKDRWLA